MVKKTLHIGILNLMHDKAATNADFRHVLLPNSPMPIQLHFYYPRLHYQKRPVPPEVRKILQPLNLQEVALLDAFIITGAPLDQLEFDKITYLPELQNLFKVLQYVPQRLYLCWGAMAALHSIYQVDKKVLPHKLFGVFPQQIINSSPLLTGLTNGFWAPHARYADSLQAQIRENPELEIKALNQTGQLFLVQNRRGNETMLFSHLEYQSGSLQAEYQREIAAHPERTYRRPINLANQDFAWKQAQKIFFKNWLEQVAQTVRIAV